MIRLTHVSPPRHPMQGAIDPSAPLPAVQAAFFPDDDDGGSHGAHEREQHEDSEAGCCIYLPPGPSVPSEAAAHSAAAQAGGAASLPPSPALSPDEAAVQASDRAWERLRIIEHLQKQITFRKRQCAALACLSLAEKGLAAAERASIELKMEMVQDQLSVYVNAQREDDERVLAASDGGGGGGGAVAYPSWYTDQVRARYGRLSEAT
jgi:hypothetical protein